jgi:L-2,4-diaminobutyric acid acetyltransferase
MAMRQYAVFDRPMTQTQSEVAAAVGGMAFRRPQLADGQSVHALVSRCPPLDLNSSYSYFLLCSHHAETCVVVQQGAEMVGFLSAYRLPQAPQTLFVWQVAVDAKVRGRGLAGRMLAELLARPSCAGVHFIETTVSPSNHASRQVFSRFAARHHAAWQEDVFLAREHFGAEAHEEEVLLRIGPLSIQGNDPEACT